MQGFVSKKNEIDSVKKDKVYFINRKNGRGKHDYCSLRYPTHKEPSIHLENEMIRCQEQSLHTHQQQSKPGHLQLLGEKNFSL